jgi:hypothetical protein
MDDPRGRERRRGKRHLACFPIREHAPDEQRPRSGMIRELSVTGAQILTRTKREIGTELSLSLYLDEGAAPRETGARVVRIEPARDAGIWSWVTVVEFHQPLHDLEPLIQARADAQEHLFRPRSRPPGA